MASVDWKKRAIEQWSADPCGPVALGIFGLIAARREYAPWMAEHLAYDGSAALEVLDVGCGQGIDVCEFALAGARVTGIDLTPRHVALAEAHAREAGIEATLTEGDCEQLPFDDAAFDRVIANGVLHHTPNIAAALRELRRVLRSGGKATVIVYNRNSWHYWLNQVLWRGLLKGRLFVERGMAGVLSTGVERSSVGARPLVRTYTRRQLLRLMKEARFASISTWVSPFRPADSPFTRWIPDAAPLSGGWYIVAHGYAEGGALLPHHRAR
jgi:ubiquinone/menaquinone biosynthesis C-methylase UbiE